MLNIIQNTIGAIRRVGESVVRAGLKMWLPFTKAEPLGEDLVINGDFSNGDNEWTAYNSDISVVNEVLRISISSSGVGFAYQSISTEVGRTYKFQASFSNPQGNVNNLFMRASTTVGGSDVLNEQLQPVAITKSVTFVATTTTTYISVGLSFDSGESIDVDNVSIQEYAQETPDISGNDNNAILKTGKCLTFTGNDSVQTAFPSSKDIKTIAFWIYPTHSSTDEVVFYFGDAAGGDKYIDLDHLVMESDANNNINFDVYIDGVLRGETNYGGNNPTLNINQWQRVVLTTDTAINTTNDKFYIAHKENGAFGRFNMSDLQVYGAEFTTDDIAYDYANPQKLVTDNASSNVTLNDLHAWWHMSEGDGTIAFDSAPLIGKELVINGDFATDSDWDTPTGWNIENGKATKSGTSSNGLRQAINLPIARVFQLTFEVSGKTSGYLKGEIFGGGGSDEFFNYQIENGSHSFTTTSTVNRNQFQFYAYAGFDGSIDNVSIKEVYNIDGETYDASSLGATYDDAQERIPQLGMMNWSKGSNLIEYSEDFSEWTQYGSPTIVQNIISPDGTLTGTQLTRGSNQTPLRVSNITTLNQEYTFSVYAKKGSVDVMRLDIGDEAFGSFTLTDEWQRFTVTSTPTSYTHVDISFATSVSGDDIYIWGAQLEQSSSATAYRRTNGTAVTDATLISCATDSQKDILGNAVRVKGSGFNLDGTGYAEVLDDNDFDIPACNSVDEGAFSFMGWVKFKYELQTGSSYNVIYNNGISMTQTGTFSIASANTNKITAWVSGSFVNSSTTHSHGDWVHFALTRDVNGSVKLYINKTLENTITQSYFLSNSENKKIGWDNTNGDRFYNELIDDIKLYNRELSSDEIEQNYNATKSGHNN